MGRNNKTLHPPPKQKLKTEVKALSRARDTPKTRRTKAIEKSAQPNLHNEVSPNGSTSLAMDSRIAARAFEIYEERCRIGEAMQDWLRAEQEIMR